MYFLTPSSVISLFIAVVLGVYVAPHLSLVSRTSGKAMTIAAWTLGLNPVLDFFTPILMANVPFDLQWFSFGPFIFAVFWGCLAWSVFALIQSAPPRGLS